MLEMPAHGFQRSIKVHRVKLGVLVDWIEASVVFADDSLSRSDVVDVLCENEIYEDQTFAHECVTDAWIEMNRRQESVGQGSQFDVDGKVIKRLHEWNENVAYSFCMLLASQSIWKAWSKKFGTDFTEQGLLFEELTAESLEYFGWDVLRAGWAPGNAAKIEKVVHEVSSHVGEPVVPDAIKEWLSDNANDEQLDVVCSDPYYDGFGGRPIYLFQCASGGNWPCKIQTPDPVTWGRIIGFSTPPQRGFAIPFGLMPEEFRKRAGRVQGVFLDRFRLQSPAFDGNVKWLSNTLEQKIRRWMKPRVKTLPVV
jgi:hypothetical protein